MNELRHDIARSLRIPVRVVLFKDIDVWFAHCLEIDLSGDGATKEDAIRCLATSIEIQANSLTVISQQAAYVAGCMSKLM